MSKVTKNDIAVTADCFWVLQIALCVEIAV